MRDFEPWMKAANILLCLLGNFIFLRLIWRREWTERKWEREIILIQVIREKNMFRDRENFIYWVICYFFALLEKGEWMKSRSKEKKILKSKDKDKDWQEMLQQRQKMKKNFQEKKKFKTLKKERTAPLIPIGEKKSNLLVIFVCRSISGNWRHKSKYQNTKSLNFKLGQKPLKEKVLRQTSNQKRSIFFWILEFFVFRPRHLKNLLKKFF